MQVDVGPRDRDTRGYVQRGTIHDLGIGDWQQDPRAILWRRKRARAEKRQGVEFELPPPALHRCGDHQLTHLHVADVVLAQVRLVHDVDGVARLGGAPEHAVHSREQRPLIPTVLPEQLAKICAGILRRQGQSRKGHRIDSVPAVCSRIAEFRLCHEREAVTDLFLERWRLDEDSALGTNVAAPHHGRRRRLWCGWVLSRRAGRVVSDWSGSPIGTGALGRQRNQDRRDDYEKCVSGH